MHTSFHERFLISGKSHQSVRWKDTTLGNRVDGNSYVHKQLS